MLKICKLHITRSRPLVVKNGILTTTGLWEAPKGQHNIQALSIRSLIAVAANSCHHLKTSQEFQHPSPVRLYSVKAANYYDVLQITPKAGQTQIKAAYYRLSKKYHPDVNKADDAKQMFGTIAEAYEILGNKRSRRQYDQSHGFGNTGMQARTTYNSDYQSIIKKNPVDFKDKRNAPIMGKTDIYDFDEFYKQHYGTYVKFSKQKSESEKEFIRELNRQKELQRKRGLMYSVVMGSVLCVSVYYALKGD